MGRTAENELLAHRLHMPYRNPKGVEMGGGGLIQNFKNMTLQFIKTVSVASYLAVTLHASAVTTSTPHTYLGTVTSALKIGSDLYETLDAKYQRSVEPAPITLVPMDLPAVAPTEDNMRRQVTISAGFISLINRIAHAKAIDKIEPGYFDRYILSLSDDSKGGFPPPLPNIDNPRYWNDDVMNDQGTYFNQMMGLTMAINLSHHYLGEYHKYRDQMSGKKIVPINNFLTTSEWERSVKVATENALECAFGTDGGTMLFAAISRMPHRPAWAAYILPENVNVAKLNKKLAKYEYDFFHGGR
jgi:hypothetical protein